MKSRFFHVRAPLVIKQYINNKEVTPAIIPELAAANGGCTIHIQDHDEEYVAVRVAWCRHTDNYNRALGRAVCLGGKKVQKVLVKGQPVERVVWDYPGKEPNLVKRSELETELEAIEEQMLVSCAWPTRHDQKLLKDCLGDWSRAAARFFTPKEEKVASA